MRSNYRTALGLLLATCLLASCAPAVPRTAADRSCPPAPERGLDAQGLMAYQGCLGSLAPQKLTQEHDAVGRHFAQTGSGADRIKLALLLSVPGTPFHSVASARQVLGAADSKGDAVPPELRGLARMLEGTLARQQTLEDRVQGLEKDLAAEKQRSDALQAQIDSIKNLERNMTRRGPR